MNVRVSYTVDVNDTFRRGIRRFYGKPGLATRAEVKQWFWMYGRSMDDDISYQEQTHEAAKAHLKELAGDRDA